MSDSTVPLKTRPVVNKKSAPLPLSVPHFLRERQVLQYYPVSRGELWNRVKNGSFPQPVKLSPKVAAWRSIDILQVLQQHGFDVVA